MPKPAWLIEAQQLEPLRLVLFRTGKPHVKDKTTEAQRREAGLRRNGRPRRRPR
jgi:hypothetical protein